MRIALISDTHGNLTALNAVLADIQSQGAERIIFLGDAATLGPQPVETLETLMQLNCACIMGNHDAAALDPGRAAELQIAPPLHPTLDWCVSRLRREHFDFLRSFQPTLELKLDGNLSALFFHGSPLSNTDLILSTTSVETIDVFFAGQSSALWAGGHTHVQMLRRHGDKSLLNPGSVGAAFRHAFTPGSVPALLPWAEYAIVSVEKGLVSADLRRVPFDTQELSRRVRASGMPGRDWWIEQYA